MAVPDCWVKFLAFNKLVPDDCLPDGLKGRNVYLASRVLPMGFLNSVLCESSPKRAPESGQMVFTEPCNG